MNEMEPNFEVLPTCTVYVQPRILFEAFNILTTSGHITLKHPHDAVNFTGATGTSM